MCQFSHLFNHTVSGLQWITNQQNGIKKEIYRYRPLVLDLYKNCSPNIKWMASKKAWQVYFLVVMSLVSSLCPTSYQSIDLLIACDICDGHSRTHNGLTWAARAENNERWGWMTTEIRFFTEAEKESEHTVHIMKVFNFRLLRRVRCYFTKWSDAWFFPCRTKPYCEDWLFTCKAVRNHLGTT